MLIGIMCPTNFVDVLRVLQILLMFYLDCMNLWH